ncbi:MAG TPA: hypothetical protein VEC37_01190, partial [Bacillota bacterium]|nr:hypothetical protein [Bacillota bacterium]
MKTILQLFFLLTLLIWNSSGAWGMVHSSGEMFLTDTWYSVEPEQPSWQLAYQKLSGSNTYIAKSDFYQNEHTFFQVNSSKIFRFKLWELAGSYLFDSGFFVGLAHSDTSSSDSTLIAPGYRFNLNEQSFVALSLDYLSSSGADRVTGYDLDLHYYGDSFKFIGEIYRPRDDEAEDTYVDAGFAIAVTKGLVVGCDYNNDYHDLSAGFTYNTKPLIIDYEYLNSKDEDYAYSKLSGMARLGAYCGVGMEYLKYTDISDPRYTLKFKFTNDKTN